MKNNKIQVKTSAVNGSFVTPTKAFTQVTNTLLRDDTISLSAKGLYSLIASYITLAGFTLYKKYIQSQCAEGRYAFDSSWKELQEAGYLVHHRVRGEGGTFAYQYELTLPAFTGEQEMPEEALALMPTEPDKVKPKTLPQIFSAEHIPQVGSFSLPNQPAVENKTPVLLYSNNKTISNKTQSVRLNTERGSYNKLYQQLAEQIDLDYFLEESAFEGAPRQVVLLLLDWLEEKLSNNPSPPLQALLFSVDSCAILAFLEHMGERKQKRIYHPKAYWCAAFENYLKESCLAVMAV